MGKTEQIAQYLVTASPAAPVFQLGELLEQRNVGSVAIVEGDAPVGMVTDRDLVLKVLNVGNDPETVEAREVMSSDPATMPAESSPLQILHRMVETSARRMPIVDEGELVDWVSLDDLIRHPSPGERDEHSAR